MVQFLGDPVEVFEELGRVEVERGQRVRRGAQPAHGRGGVDAAAHHVAHDQRGLALVERDHVEPVAADLGGGARGLVAGGDLQATGHGRVAGQQAALEGESGVAGVLVPAGVVDLDRRAGRQLPRQQQVVLAEGLRMVDALEVEGAQHLAARDQRHGQIGVHPGPGQQRGGLG